MHEKKQLDGHQHDHRKTQATQRRANTKRETTRRHRPAADGGGVPTALRPSRSRTQPRHPRRRRPPYLWNRIIPPTLLPPRQVSAPLEPHTFAIFATAASILAEPSSSSAPNLLPQYFVVVSDYQPPFRFHPRRVYIQAQP